MTGSDGIAHGTYGGYQRCRRNGPPCPECLAANREYEREWRSRDSSKERVKAWAAARSRALTILARRHPGEYRDLYRQELQKLERR